MLKVHSPKEPAGFSNEPAEVFLSYIPEYPVMCDKSNQFSFLLLHLWCEVLASKDVKTLQW